jgi:hypothetical protein
MVRLLKECIREKKKAEQRQKCHSAPKNRKIILEVSVAGAQHGRETGHFHLTAAAFARFFIMAMITDFTQSSFTIDPLFEASQGLFYGFTFL